MKRNIPGFKTILQNVALTGHKDANYELGLISEKELEKDKGRPHTLYQIELINKAIKKYAIAAIQGHFEAKSALERLTESEWEKAQDFLESYRATHKSYDIFCALKKFKNAAMGGNTEALNILKELAEKDSIIINKENKEIAKKELDEVTTFKEMLKNFDKKAPEQSVIAGADAGVD
jgi:TPR repeat protein